MNIETEMEWNSHMIKTGKVFGTYDFMISKGHSWADINYVVWDIEDDTGMPLVKAVAYALGTHPDTILKDEAQYPDMRSYVNAQQVDAANARMEGQRDIGQTPEPTGKELAQAGKYGQALVTSLRNRFTGGDYSRGGNVDANAGTAGQMKERYRLGDKLSPSKTWQAWKKGGNDKFHRRNALNTIAQTTDAQNREGGKAALDMTPAELARAKELEDSLSSAQSTLKDPALSRSMQDRKKDAANYKWQQEKKLGNKRPAPYPMRLARVEQLSGKGNQGAGGGGEETFASEMPAGDEEKIAEQVEAIANENPDAAKDTTPKDEEKKVETQMPGSEANAGPPKKEAPAPLDRKGAWVMMGGERLRADSNAAKLFDLLDKAKAGNSPLGQTLQQAQDSLRFNAKKKAAMTPELFERIMNDMGYSSEMFDKLSDKEKKGIEAAVEEVVKPTEEEEPEKEKFVSEVTEEPEEEQTFASEIQEEKPKKNRQVDSTGEGEVITSNDAINSAWDHLTILKRR